MSADSVLPTDSLPRAPRPALRARRREVGLTQEKLAETIGSSVSTISHWEMGLATPGLRFRQPLADELKISVPELNRLIDPGHVALSGHAVAPWLGHYASLEQGAAKLQSFEPVVIPGLLQTQDYASAVARAHYVPVSEESVSERVNARMARQVVLEREPDPLNLVCVVYEPALHRVTGTPEVVAVQLRHLGDLAARPNIELRIIPASASAMHSVTFGSFDLFTSAGSTSPFIVCTEDLSGFNYQERLPVIDDYVHLFDYLVNSALSATESAELIRATAEDYR